MQVVLINTWDPRHNNVVLYENRYFQHITARHPGIDVEHICLVVEEPDVISRDRRDRLVENYYKQGAIPDMPALFLKVSVRFESDAGKVVTAFVVDRPRLDEEIVWKP